MKNLRNTKALVQSILEKDQRARNSDSYLYLQIIRRIAVMHGYDLDKICITDFLLHMAELGFPPFESVRRTRQKVQAECPWLAACRKVEKCREESETVYREFARA